MKQEEINALQSLMNYANLMRRFHEIKRIGIPLSHDGRIIGCNLYPGYRRAAIVELNPNWHFSTWNVLWLELINGEWHFSDEYEHAMEHKAPKYKTYISKEWHDVLE